jgi:hypothetical protein
MSSPVAHPPTKTSSSSSGCISLRAASSRGRFGSFMELMSKPLDQFLLRKPAFSGATFTHRVDKGEHLVQGRIAQGSGGSSFVQRLGTDAAMLTFRKGPYWWQLRSWLDLLVERPLDERTNTSAQRKGPIQSLTSGLVNNAGSDLLSPRERAGASDQQRSFSKLHGRPLDERTNTSAQRKGPMQSLTSGLREIMPAATYSPMEFPPQYHRRYQA